jgi:hypothetical protein
VSITAASCIGGGLGWLPLKYQYNGDISMKVSANGEEI